MKKRTIRRVASRRGVKCGAILKASDDRSERGVGPGRMVSQTS